MVTLLQDIRFGLRMLRKSPGFTVIALITLALGIGANTAIFSIVNAVLLKPLPYPQPERLVFMTSALTMNGTSRNFATSYPDFLDWRATAKSFTGMASYHDDSFTLTGTAEPLHISGVTVAGDFFSVLGTQPLLGRGFTQEDEKPGTRVVVLSHELWQSVFHGDRRILGQAITLDKQRYNVVGIMPAGFAFPLDQEAPKLWRTFAIESESKDPVNAPAATSPQGRGAHYLNVVGRLKADVSFDQAREEMNVIARNLAAQYPDSNKKFPSVGMALELDHLVGDTRPRMIVLLISVGVVLLIACLNVANLLLVRASKRSREIAIRASIGAKRLQIIRQMLTESMVLGLGGALLGIPIAMWALKVFIMLNAEKLPRIQSAGLDGNVLLFTAGVAILTSLIFGLVPALRTSKPNLTEFMKEGRGTTAGAAHQRLRGVLVVLETTIGLVLLVIAGLLVRSFHRLVSVDPGLNPANVLTVVFDLPDTKYNDQQQIDFYVQLLNRLRTLPGVVSAGTATPLPLNGDNAMISFQIEERPVPKSEAPSADIEAVSPEFFHTLNIPLLRGRDFSEHDTTKAPGVMIVNDAFARKYFPNEDAIGKYVTPGISNGGAAQKRQIIAVVGNVKARALDAEDVPAYYVPSTQLNFGSQAVCVRTSVDPHSLTPAIRNVVASMDPDLPLYDVKTMEEYLAASVATPRFNALLLEAFAGLALLLTGIGLYGVISYAVTQRTHEIGVRITLGASRGSVVRMVLKSGLQLTGIGIVVGVVFSLIAARFATAFSGLLFGIKATDASTFIAVVLMVGVVSLLACYVPAYRAAKVDPMIALRYE